IARWAPAGAHHEIFVDLGRGFRAELRKLARRQRADHVADLLLVELLGDALRLELDGAAAERQRAPRGAHRAARSFARSPGARSAPDAGSGRRRRGAARAAAASRGLAASSDRRRATRSAAPHRRRRSRNFSKPPSRTSPGVARAPGVVAGVGVKSPRGGGGGWGGGADAIP